MPAVSKAQYKFFKMLENNPDLAKKHGMTSQEAAELTKENKGKKRFSKLIEKINKKDK